MAQEVSTIALVTGLARDRGTAAESAEALLRVQHAARSALSELRLVARVLDHWDEGDEGEAAGDVTAAAPPPPSEVAAGCLCRLRSLALPVRWKVPPEVDVLPGTVRTTLAAVLRAVTETVLGSGASPRSLDLQVLVGEATVDIDVVVLGGVDLTLADALLSVPTSRVRMSGGDLGAIETEAGTSRRWSVWVWLRC